MEGKRKRGGDDGDDENSSSSDDPSVHHHTSGERSGQNQTNAYYSAHITSVCEALNTDAERSMSTFEKLMLKKRRETNRLSARRCRRRRRDEIKVLEEQLRLLQLENEQLEAEKTWLQAEYQREMAVASSRNSAGDDLHARDVPQASQAGDATTMLRRLLQENARTQIFTPNIHSNLAHMGPSFASLSGLMPTSARLGNLGHGQNPATNSGRGFASPASQASSMFDLLNCLSLFQTSQGSSTSSTASSLTPWVLPQSLAVASSMDTANRFNAATLPASLQQSVLDEIENSRSVGSMSAQTNVNEFTSWINPDTDESKRQYGKYKKR
jgi:hypothetical protein